MHTITIGTARTTRGYSQIAEEVCRTRRPRIQLVAQSVRRLCGEFLQTEGLENCLHSYFHRTILPNS